MSAESLTVLTYFCSIVLMKFRYYFYLGAKPEKSVLYWTCPKKVYVYIQKVLLLTQGEGSNFCNFSPLQWPLPPLFLRVP